MHIISKPFNLFQHCKVNSNNDSERFVGIKIHLNQVQIYFPIGYNLPTDEEELKKDVRNLIKILEEFTDNNNNLISNIHSSTTQENLEFPINAYLNVIKDYWRRNGKYYTENKNNYKVKNKGKTHWGKTIKTQTPQVNKNNVIYLNRISKVNDQNFNSIITQIHKYCAYESFEKLGWLFTNNKLEKMELNLDKTHLLSLLKSKLINIYNDLDKNLFKSMISIINYNDNTIDKHQFSLGTENFEIVWERLIDKFLGIKEKNKYFPRAIWKEKIKPNSNTKTSALEPDTIMIYDNKYYVLDAKYYKYGISPKDGVKLLPRSSDINKQITYGQYLNNKLEKDNKQKTVFNAFVMPFNKDNNEFNIKNWCGNVAEATGDWISNPKSFEKIQAIVIDARYLMKNYNLKNDFMKEKIANVIEDKN
ncbi:LlaJI family restriction endonuclease [Mesomycoplasma hyorhinis]|uniref:LlaJI family restriction endonuclease n=1 Tax=Mesomycoplasma hyorhinis TaxID=2100 RepID=UPI001C058BBE|nr:LlaJI family restriction endonuclease [Mesomycoplasma hyorhinis]